jgi:hypothetical protein
VLSAAYALLVVFVFCLSVRLVGRVAADQVEAQEAKNQPAPTIALNLAKLKNSLELAGLVRWSAHWIRSRISGTTNSINTPDYLLIPERSKNSRNRRGALQEGKQHRTQGSASVSACAGTPIPPPADTFPPAASLAAEPGLP